MFNFRTTNTQLFFCSIAYSLLIILPLITFGYTLSVDLIWGPTVPHIPALSNTYILYVVLNLGSTLFRGDIVEDITLLAIFIIMTSFSFQNSTILNRQTSYVVLFSPSIYAFNPFTYSRFLEGQWLVLLGYALLPWSVVSFYRLMLKPSWRQAAIAAAWTISIALTSIHTVGIVLLAHVVIFIVVNAGDRSLFKQRLKYIAAASGAWLVVNAIWLVPLVTGTSRTSEAISGFRDSQLNAFATVGTIGSSVPLSTLFLEGFWADSHGRYVLPSSLGWWWYIVASIILGLVAVGIYKIIKRRDTLGISLVILGVIGWWLAMGIGCSWSAGTTHFLIDHLPFYRGYREPQKWLMLLVLLYSYAGAIGLGAVAGKVKNANARQYVIGAGLLLPLLYTPTLLWGAGGQLRSAPYPKDYAIAAKRLDASGTDYKVFVLPWHQYLPLSYAGRVVANPASHYFKQHMITGDNPEIVGVPPQGQSPLYKLINNQLLPDRNYRSDVITQLKPYDVRYVMLLKEADWRDYDWVNKQDDLTLVQDTATIRIYKVKY